MTTLLLLSAVIAAAPVPKAASEGRITLWDVDQLISMYPDGSDVVKTPVRNLGLFSDDFKLSTDARIVVYRRPMSTVRPANLNEWQLLVRALGNDPPAVVVSEGMGPLRYEISPNGSTVYISGKRSDGQAQGQPAVENWSYDVATKTMTKLALPERMSILAVSGDGCYFLVNGPDAKSKEFRWQLQVTSADGKKSKAVFEPNSFPRTSVAFSPLGDKLFATIDTYKSITPRGHSFAPDGTPVERNIAIDLKTGLISDIAVEPTNHEIRFIAWSPDAARIAYVCILKAGVPGASPKGSLYYLVMVANADGTAAKEIYRSPNPIPRAFQWR